MTVVLVVDDCPDVLEILGAMLEGGGYTAILTHEPRRAEQLSREIDFDLAVCDLYLPHESKGGPNSSHVGLDLISRLRTRLPQLPVIVMSGNIEGLDRKERMAAGFNAVLSKPFDRAALFGQIEAVLRARR
jgi:CheY-like chemotaxis protein